MMTQYVDVILSGLSDFNFINVFIAVFLLGESAVIASVVAAKQGFMSLNSVVMAAILGTLLADIFWLLVGRYTPQDKLPKKLKQNMLTPVNNLLKKLVNRNLFLTLVCLKFLITIRLPLLLHLSKYKVSWFRLLGYDLIGTLIFVFTLTLISIRFESYISENLNSGELILTVLAGIAFLLITSRLLFKALLKWTTKSQWL